MLKPISSPSETPAQFRRRSKSITGRATSLVCESLEGRTLFSTFTVTSQSDDGPGTLREAIQLANADSGVKDTIDFNVDLGFQDDDNAADIYLQSPLPEITDPLTIGATNQHAYLFGAGAGAGADGLKISAGNSDVTGMGFAGFGGAAIHLLTRGNNQIHLNNIGLVTPPDTVSGNHEGIRVDSSNSNQFTNNTIIGCSADGIVLQSAAGNFISENTIGLRFGDVAAPNGGSGIALTNASDANAIVSNTISSNAGAGIFLEGATYTFVGGNIIGLDSTKTLDRGNGLNGIRIDQSGSNNQIGNGPINGDGNYIAFNHEAGVNILNGVHNSVRGNYIYSNASMGIDLAADGASANDALDADTGANDLQNYPVLTSAISDGINSGTVHVVFDGKPSTVLTLDLYEVDHSAALGGQGDRPLFTKTFVTDVNGHYSADVAAPTIGSNKFVSGTVSDPLNTSEFSPLQAVVVVAPPSNTNPDAVDDAAQTLQDTPVTIDVLANDTDADNDSIGIFAFSQASHGTVTGAGSKLVYTPNPGYAGPDSFGYEASDVNGATDTATVNITVTANVPQQNKNPIAKNDLVMTLRGQPVVIDVLKNDSDPDGDTIGFSGFSGAAHAQLQSNGGKVIYIPIGTFTGTDTFSYTISDSKGGQASAMVTVKLKPNTAPVVNVVPDVHDVGSSALEIVGTDKNDTIDVKSAGAGKVSVKVNGKSYGTFNVDTRILAYGLKGDDKITIDSAASLKALMFGGDGNDTLTGGGGDDLLLGEGGDDKLYGRGGRDILIGGHQKDLLDGGAGGDLLVAGPTDLDGDIYSLFPITDEWSRKDLPFAQRLAHITTGGQGAYNGGNLINATTASSASGTPDTLTGGSESDGFFYNFDQKSSKHDKVTDLTAADKGIDIG